MGIKQKATGQMFYHLQNRIDQKVVTDKILRPVTNLEATKEQQAPAETLGC